MNYRQCYAGWYVRQPRDIEGGGGGFSGSGGGGGAGAYSGASSSAGSFSSSSGTNVNPGPGGTTDNFFSSSITDIFLLGLHSAHYAHSQLILFLRHIYHLVYNVLNHSSGPSIIKLF